MNKKILLCSLLLMIAVGAIGLYIWRNNFEKNNIVISAVLAHITPEELVNKSDGVVLGVVEDQRVEKSLSTIRPGEKDIVTNSVIRVEKYFSNPHNLSAQEITVQVIGGTIDDETMDAEGAPQLKKGDQVVLFLKQVGENIFTVYGWSQGKYTVTAGGQLGSGEELSYLRSVFGKEDMTLTEMETSITSFISRSAIKN